MILIEFINNRLSKWLKYIGVWKTVLSCLVNSFSVNLPLSELGILIILSFGNKWGTRDLEWFLFSSLDTDIYFILLSVLIGLSPIKVTVFEQVRISTGNSRCTPVFLYKQQIRCTEHKNSYLLVSLYEVKMITNNTTFWFLSIFLVELPCVL